jgi:hypothetical protein
MADRETERAKARLTHERDEAWAVVRESRGDLQKLAARYEKLDGFEAELITTLVYIVLAELEFRECCDETGELP